MYRDQAIAQVTGNNPEWCDQARAAFDTWLAGKPTGFEFIAEDFRLDVQNSLPVPPTPNAWGGIMSGISRSGLIAETGQLRKMKSGSSHARRSIVYRKV